MLDIAKTVTLNLVALVCAGISGYLAVNGTEGWGWFLFAAIITSNAEYSSITTKEEKNDD